MKYIIFRHHENDDISLSNELFEKTVVFKIDFSGKWLLGLQFPRASQSETFFRRRLRLTAKEMQKILIGLEPGQSRSIRAGEARFLLSEFIAIQKNIEKYAVIILRNSEVLLYLRNDELNRFETLPVQKLKATIENQFVNPVSRSVNMQQVEQQGKLLLRRFPQLKKVLKITLPLKNIIVTGAGFRVLNTFSSIFSVHKQLLHLNSNTDSFQNISGASLRQRSRKIKKILIITNLNGDPLPRLSKDVEYFARGEPGFIWKHVFGRLTRSRLVSEILGKSYDLVIYRGHSEVVDGEISYPCLDGIFSMPPLIVPYMIHLSCMYLPESQEILHFPFEQGVLPRSFIEDQEDSGFVSRFIELYRQNGTFSKSAQKAFQGTNFQLWHG